MLAEKPDTELVVMQPKVPNAMALLQMAVDRGASIDTIERLAKLQSEMQEKQSAIDFDDSLNRVQQKLRPVSQDMERPKNRGKYSSYKALDRAVRPEYSAEGFAVSFSEEEGTTAELICMVGWLSKSGHRRPFRKVLPVDAKGPQGGDVMTKTDASCSASSRCKRYILKAMFNLAEGEDDKESETGEVGQQGPRMPEGLVVERIEWIRGAERSSDMVPLFQDAVKEAKGDKRAIRDFTNAMLGVCIPWISGAANVATLQGVYARAYDMADSVDDQDAKKQLVGAKDARKKQLQGAQR